MFEVPTTQIAAACALALAGGSHCAGMCGGFAGALQIRRVPALSASALAAGYHAGRLTSYTLAGLLAGFIGGVAYASDVLVLQILLLCAGSVMLLLVGASLIGKPGGRFRWARLEPLGAPVWQFIAPFARRLFPPRTRWQAYVTGLLWGWIPCGMVYGALPLALTAADPVGGALVMLGFGLGTLPAMLAVDATVLTVHRVERSSGPGRWIAGARAWLMPCAGATIVVFGLSGLAHAATVAGARHPAIALVASICHR